MRNSLFGDVLGVSDDKVALRAIAAQLNDIFSGSRDYDGTVFEFFERLFDDERVTKLSHKVTNERDLLFAMALWLSARIHLCIEQKSISAQNWEPVPASWLSRRLKQFKKSEARIEYIRKLIQLRTQDQTDENETEYERVIKDYALLSDKAFFSKDEKHQERYYFENANPWAFAFDCLDYLSNYDFALIKDQDVRKRAVNWRSTAVKDGKSELANERKMLGQLLANEFDLDVHIRALSARLGEAKIEEMLGENQGDMVLLYKALHDAFDRHGLIALERLAAVPKDVHRINQIETIIDLYNLKIERTENDASLSDDVRERKVQALQHLMEQDINALGGVV